MTDTFPCPSCAKPVPGDAESCPHCQFYFGPAGDAPSEPPPENSTPPAGDAWGGNAPAVDEPAPAAEPEKPAPPPLDEQDAWGGAMDFTGTDTAYDHEVQQEKQQADGGPDWSQLDSFLGTDTSQPDPSLKIVRDARPAGNVVRLIAWLIDFVLLEIPALIGIAVLAATGAGGEDFTMYAVALLAVDYLVLYIPYALQHTGDGQTPGKKLLGLEVVQENGAPVTGRHVWRRAIAGLFGPVLWIVAVFEIQNRAGHDLIAGTRVIKD